MTHLNVAVRVRPLSEREIISNAIPIVEVTENIVAVTNLKVPEHYAGDSRERVRRFSFDFCFDASSAQEDVFNAVNEVIGNAVKKKYHTCILAYGQSSSGKTHTMMGFNEELGLTPRLCERIFTYLEETNGDEDDNEKVTISYIEIYNEKVNDLLSQSNKEHVANLRVREHPTKGTYVQGLKEYTVKDSETLLEWLKLGNKKRRVSATSINPQSSRSHSVVTLKCLGGVKLTLVDLAGSERSSKVHTKSTLLEGANINKSLVALGNVISSLADQSTRNPRGFKKRFVPYRDSVLTWLLKDTLGGNSQTLMIATISSSSTCYNETVNTLRFGHRAKQIVAQPISNEDPKQRTIRELKSEVFRLKELLLLYKIEPDLFQTQQQREQSIGETNSNTDQQLIKTDAATNTENFNTNQLLPPFLQGLIIDQLPTSSQEITPTIIDEFSLKFFGDSTIHPHTDDDPFEKCYKYDKVKSFINTVLCKTITSLDTTKTFNISQRNPNIWITEPSGSPCSTTEKLIPVMDVTSTNGDKPVVKLRRTYSVCSDLDSKEAKMYGSHETLMSAATKGEKIKKSSISTTLRKKSIDKSSTSLTKVEAKVDSIRKVPIKPRSEIVAAVTERLYSKIKKKEASTETEEVQKENKGTMARLRLQDITQRAMRYYKRKHADTQTEYNNIIRVKETSTDVDDLKIASSQSKNAVTSTEPIKSRTVGTDCNLFGSFENNDNHHTLKLTSSCGTQAGEDTFENLDQKSNHNLLSFTKYLKSKEMKDAQRIPNPIYTSSVNIHVSHNYLNGTKRDSISGDSLDEQSSQNVTLPTPDLISNHNSLEQQQNSDNSKTEKVNYARTKDMTTQDETNENFNDSFGETCTARSSIIPQLLGQAGVSISPTYAPEIHILKNPDRCYPMRKHKPQLCKPNIVDNDNSFTESATIEEPTILKSIMKQHHIQCDQKCCFDSDLSDISLDTFDNVSDSLNYHINKKVHFTGEMKKNNHMFDAMTNFLKEASALMANLSIVANKLEKPEQAYEMQVTLNDITEMVNRKCKKRYKRKKKNGVSGECEHISSQSSPDRTSVFNETELEIPDNKYEMLVKNSCDRLEQLSKIPLKSARIMLDESTLHRFPQPFSVSDWPDFSSLPHEDSSLESNPTYSDYGSLPRRKVKHKKFLSPSEYLRQLTTMRRQIIDTSRDELLNETHIDFE